jgi:hypothetical protein
MLVPGLWMMRIGDEAGDSKRPCDGRGGRSGVPTPAREPGRDAVLGSGVISGVDWIAQDDRTLSEKDLSCRTLGAFGAEPGVLSVESIVIAVARLEGAREGDPSIPADEGVDGEALA